MSAELELRIEQEYVRRGDQLGWRLLYSPASVLNGAQVAFIGLNPGGAVDELDHPRFATVNCTSAYVNESWKGESPGEEGLQRQVRQLFEMVGVRPHEVLAGNLVPFRSRDWTSLGDQRAALRFGREIWTGLLANAAPRLVVAMGSVAAVETSRILGIETEAVRVGWGDITASRGSAGDVTFVGLPHLSRFRLFGRPASQAILEELFSGS